jgi:uncharacterized Ntn-hydrolase superfamily protein
MTYSIVARDPATGEFGVAVQSHYFSTGSVVPWAEAGVGAVATQASADISYGPLGLQLMREGRKAQDALDELVARDGHSGHRQVAMIDAQGNTAAHTGQRCISFAGHRTAANVSVQANMMERDTVPDAMLRVYLSVQGALSERMLAALDAAEAEGGDIRGRQSAAMLIVTGKPTGKHWADRTLDLRVEDHPDPLLELRRLIGLHRAYRLSDEAGKAASSGDMTTAAARMTEAMTLMAGNPELAFWAAVSLAASGQVALAKPLLARARAVDERWAELLRRLPATGNHPLSDETIAALLS